MIQLDMRTIVFSNVLIHIVCLHVVIQLWRQGRNRYPGFNFWVIDYLFQVTALVLIVLRGAIPDWMSYVLANAMVVSGALLGLMGLERFVGMKGRHIHNYILIAAFTAFHAYFTFFSPSQALRDLNFSVGFLIICFQCSWLMLYRVGRDTQRLTRGVGIVFAVYSAISVVRVIEFSLFTHPAADYFHSGLFSTLILISYELMFILLTYSLVLMLNRRLLYDIGTEEEKFSKAFHSSPYAIIMSRLSDGTIIEVNDGFEAISGFSADEVKGRTTFSLHMWDRPEDRDSILAELSARGSVREKEFRFRKKSGDLLTGLFSADPIVLNGEMCLLSSVNDITERKRDEEKINALLREKELLLKETHHRIKNNMSVINSLLLLQSGANQDQSVRAVLNEAASRVQSMAVLYDKLYRSESFLDLSIRDFLTPLIKQILALFRGTVQVKAEVAVEDFMVSARILSSLGIIINEFITNSIKYAFRGASAGLITVSVSKSGPRVTLAYSDNGIGLPETFSFENSTGFGMQLVYLLVQQIGGAITVERGGGAKFIIEFSV